MNIQISIRHMTSSQISKQLILDLCAEVRYKYKNIQNIEVKIDDVNGPNKAGIDKCCHLKVRGKDQLNIDINNMDGDITCAIDNAFFYLRQTLESYSYKGHKKLYEKDLDNHCTLEA